jgi:signal peptide peptidase SppA
MICDFSGGTSYEALARGLEAALASRAITKILLRASSPGGEADGVCELGKAIAAARAHKPVWAYVDSMCASAAYWLASQADHIIAEESSEIGSIGVRCGMVDYSAADQMAGVREIEVISSQSPGKRSKPVDDEVVGRLQTRIDDLAELFLAAVASGRGVSVETVQADFGQGDVMIASKALAAGLIDEVGNFNDTLAAFAGADSSSGPSARSKDRTMAKENGKPHAGDAPEWQCSGCNEMMGPSAKAYCAKCGPDSEGDDDEDEDDEDEAKALGLDPKASAAARRERMVALVEFEQTVLTAVGAKNRAAAMARIDAAGSALTRVAELEAELKQAASAGRGLQLRALLETGLQGSAGETAKLSLGAIQKGMATALRGENKKAWQSAMQKLTADADDAAMAAAKDPSKGKPKSVGARQIIDAACSVAPMLSAEDMEALSDYVGGASPVAATNHIEPHRDGEKEGEELNAEAAKVKALADNARAVLNRNTSKPAAK